MWVIKVFMFALIIGASAGIGIMISKKYSSRVLELKEMKNALNMFENKIKFTYEDIPTVFKDISNKIQGNIGNIFRNATDKMDNLSAGEAWINSLDITITSLKKEDIDVLKGLGRMLGKTDINGQVSEINLVSDFIEIQIEDAQQEKNKSAKMYKTLGVVIGITIVVILA